MKIIQAINPAWLPFYEKSIFLAGGITGCPGWQYDMIELLKDTDLTIINPRRNDWPEEPKVGENTVNFYKMEVERQINWEYNFIEKADEVLFWFPKETLCPITLYELGKVSVGAKKMYIGVHPKYQRKMDVEIQTALIRPKGGLRIPSDIVYSLEDLANQVKEYHERRN